jgi:tetratricopeptide (TPR) repeat protein
MRALSLLSILLAAASAAGSPAQTPPPRDPKIQVEDLPPEGSPTAGARDPGELAALEAEAERLYADGELGQALVLYADLAARHPDAGGRARVGITAAWLSFQLGDRDAAARQLGRVLFERPAAPFRPELFNAEFAALFQDAQRDAVAQRARAAAERTGVAVDAIRAGRYDEARRELSSALELAPDDPEVLYNLALVDQRQGRHDAALAGFEKILSLGRAQPARLARELEVQVLNNIAVLYFARADYEVARDALERALRLDPDDARAVYNLGLTRQRLGDAEGGFSALRQARRLDPRDTDIARALALADIARGQWVEAVALLLETTRDRPEDPELWFQLARAQRGLGNAEGALQSLAGAERLDPGGRAGVALPAALAGVEILRQRGDSAGAAAAAERAVALDPNGVDAWMMLGLCRLDGGDAAGARAALERARALAPGRADVAHNLGTACLAQRDWSAAENAFRAALELDPSDADARSVLDRIAAQRAAAAAPARPARGRPAPPALGATLIRVDYAPLGIEGLRVETVAADGAAARAGLAAGDLVLRVDGRPVETPEALRKRAIARRGGIVLDLLRAGRPVQLRLKLE